MPLTENDVIRIRQFLQKMESGLVEGMQVYATYHDSNLAAVPSDPTGGGTTGGWHREPTEASNWMSVKTALKDTAGTWGTPIRVFGLQGTDTAGVGQSDDVPKLVQIKFIGDGESKVGWTGGTVEYGGNSYAITVKPVGDGSTDTFIYWDDADGQTSFKTHATLAMAIAANHHYVCRNDSGVATPAWIQRIILGGVIQAGTLNAAIAIIAKSVTSSELSDAVNADLAQGIADAATAQAAADTAQSDADTAQGAADAAQADATTGIADAATAQGELDEIAADTKVTPVEKLEAKQRWEAIVVEGTATTGTIPVQATAFGVADTDFDTAYAALNTYLNTTISVFANMSTTTSMVRDAWDTAWKNYYDERTKLLNAIASAAKDLADTAQAAAEAAEADAATAQAAAEAAQEAANAKIRTFYQAGVPTAENAGDIWYDTNDGLKMHRATAAGDNEVKGGEWEHVDLTIIDGGNITTASILAASIATYNLTAENAAIANLMVKTAHIDNLNVTTGKLADDAAHRTAFVSSAEDFFIGTGGGVILTAGLTSLGNAIDISSTVYFYNNNSGSTKIVDWELKRDGGILDSGSLSLPVETGGYAKMAIAEMPGSGSRTYTVEAKASDANYPYGIYAQTRSLRCLEHIGK